MSEIRELVKLSCAVSNLRHNATYEVMRYLGHFVSSIYIHTTLQPEVCFGLKYSTTSAHIKIVQVLSRKNTHQSIRVLNLHYLDYKKSYLYVLNVQWNVPERWVLSLKLMTVITRDSKTAPSSLEISSLTYKLKYN